MREFTENMKGLLDALGLAKRRDVRVCAVGAGGKTSLLKCLASEYRQRGIPVAVTTTTHMYAEEKAVVSSGAEPGEGCGDPVAGGGRFSPRGVRTGTARCAHRTKRGCRRSSRWPFPVLIEGDGARMLPPEGAGRAGSR